MSYELANDVEVLGQFASGKGYADLIKAAKTPALRSLVHYGISEDVTAVVQELHELIKAEQGSDIATTATALRQLASGQDLIIITNGEEA